MKYFFYLLTFVSIGFANAQLDYSSVFSLEFNDKWNCELATPHIEAWVRLQDSSYLNSNHCLVVTVGAVTEEWPSDSLQKFIAFNDRIIPPNPDPLAYHLTSDYYKRVLVDACGFEIGGWSTYDKTPFIIRYSQIEHFESLDLRLRWTLFRLYPYDTLKPYKVEASRDTIIREAGQGCANSSQDFSAIYLPAQKSLTIDVNDASFDFESYRIEVLDFSGNRVRLWQRGYQYPDDNEDFDYLWMPVENHHIRDLDVSDLPQGVYIVRVVGGQRDRMYYKRVYIY